MCVCVCVCVYIYMHPTVNGHLVNSISHMHAISNSKPKHINTTTLSVIK